MPPVDATLNVAAPAGSRPLNVADFAAPATGDATEATLAAVLAELGQKLEEGGEVALSAATLAALEQITVTVSGTPDVSDRPARLLGHVTVDAAPSTAVTGPLTDAQLRASAVAVSGSVATGALTDAQLRAAAVPVSSAALPLPAGAAKDLTLTDGSQRVGGTVAVGNFPATQPVSAVDLPLPAGAATAAKQDALLAQQQAAGDFRRLAKAEPMPGEELRFDDVASGDLYIGANVALTSTATATWKVCKYTRTSTGAITRLQYKTAISWDSRATGSNWA